ncbi:hypothetical protein [Persicobacter psychrovividus]|uniref:Uncharacterized protein n=1 Tax=Persicobacter psychrovividus TaxID=387638 RepID=A0ABM7VDA9_9BACT|nr:hypothetical protein PEPS_12170 [Persicobacter psychrovividus]
MNTTRIFTIVTGIVALGLAYVLFSGIKSDIDLKEKIKVTEKAVIERLKTIREAEIAYQSVYGEYTGNFDTLKAFADTGKVYIIQKKEYIKSLSYGADSVWVEVDTLDQVAVRDTIFTPEKFPNFDPSKLNKIPGSSKSFDIWAGKVKKGNHDVAVFEVKDIDPVDPTRKEDNDIFARKPLRIGSRTEVTTAGNFE